jgi:hypothetical protein
VIAADSDTAPSPVVHGFSLFAGGPLFRIARRLGLVHGEATLPRIGVVLALLTWTPLVVLTAIAAVAVHQFGSGRVAGPFVLSLGTHTRFLVTIPLFFVAEAWIGPRLNSFLSQIVESLLKLVLGR